MQIDAELFVLCVGWKRPRRDELNWRHKCRHIGRISLNFRSIDASRGALQVYFWLRQDRPKRSAAKSQKRSSDGQRHLPSAEFERFWRENARPHRVEFTKLLIEQVKGYRMVWMSTGFRSQLASCEFWKIRSWRRETSAISRRLHLRDRGEQTLYLIETDSKDFR